MRHAFLRWFAYLECSVAQDNLDHPVFGKTLTESLQYASVQISTANANGDLYVWGYIPVVVAKWFVSPLSLPFCVLTDA